MQIPRRELLSRISGTSGVAVVVVDGDLSGRARKSYWKLAAGVVVSKQYSRHGTPVLTAEKPALDDGGRFGRELGNRERSPVHEHGYDWLAFATAREPRRAHHGASERELISRQLDRSAARCFSRHVFALAQHQHNRIGLRCGAASKGEARRIRRIDGSAADVGDAGIRANSCANTGQHADRLLAAPVRRPVAERGTSVAGERP